MYLLFILLVSPAFGRPSSDQPDVGAEISNQLNNIRQFSHETGNMFHDSSLTKEVIKMLLEAEQNILEMNAELKILESEEVKWLSLTQIRNDSKDTYFPLFNEAKSYLKQTRQDLRKLADRTVTDVRDMKVMLEALDEIKDSSAAIHFLKISMNRMKDLMVETLKTLEKANGKYNSALRTFDDLNSQIQSENKKLKKMLDKNSEDYKAWLERMKHIYEVNDWLPSIWDGPLLEEINLPFSHPNKEIDTSIDRYTAELEKLKEISDKMLWSVNNFDKALNEAIKTLEKEIEIIGKWTQSAKAFSATLDTSPVELLSVLKPMRTMFITGLDNLKKAAEDFLAQPKNILTLED